MLSFNSRIINFNHRVIWNVRSSANLTLYLIPPDKPDEHDDTTKIPFEDSVGDNYPKRIKKVGGYTIKLKNTTKTPYTTLVSKSETLKVGANYQFLIQYDDDAEDTLIVVSISLK